MSRQAKSTTHQPMQQTTARRKHVPQRTCIACRRIDTKRQFVRLVRVGEDRLAIDPGGKQHGRGAYLCPDPACWQAVLKRRLLARALRLQQVHPDDQATIEQYVQRLEGIMTG